AGLLVREPGRRLSAVEAERMLRAVAAESATAGVPREALGHPQPLTAPVLVPRARGRRAPLWAAGGVLVAALAGGGFYAAPHFGGVGDAGAGSPGPSSPSPLSSSPSPSVPPSTPSTSAPASPSPSYSPPPVPDGYHLAEEPDRGFAIPVPDGWTRQVSDAGRQFVYVDPTGLVGLRIGTLDFAGPSPLQHFKDLEAQTVPNLDGYEQLRMQSTQWRGRPAAIWEFTFRGKVRPFRAIDLGFGQPGEQEFTVYLSAPADQWASRRAVFEHAVDGLRLTGPTD
ncbi:serine/threonine protein kinase, partial [Streptomyces sp. NPDC088354]